MPSLSGKGARGLHQVVGGEVVEARVVVVEAGAPKAAVATAEASKKGVATAMEVGEAARVA
jgi:hypothetical protein